jgi:hypothetical protein
MNAKDIENTTKKLHVILFLIACYNIFIGFEKNIRVLK